MFCNSTARLSALLLAFVLIGCTAKSSYDYSEAQPATDIQNSRVLADDFDVTWDRLIKNLSSEFFVINNVEKASRIINVSFSTNQPSEFIDCGTSSRSYTSGAGNTENFTYVVADSSMYRVASDDGVYAYQVHRNTDLEGRANIYVAPVSGGTEVVVNVRYVWTVRLEMYQINAINNVIISGPEHQSYPYSFETSNPLDQTDQYGRMTCSSTGVLEQKILDSAD